MRILLADDKEPLRKALRLLLEHETNSEIIGEVADAAALPAAMSALHPDLLLLDADLPGIKTYAARRQLISSLRTLQPGIYIIVLVYDPETNGLRGGAVADAYVSKAEPPDRLIAALHRAAGLVQGGGNAATPTPA